MNNGIIIRRGSTYTDVMRWAAPPFIFKAITAIPATAPCTITVTGHSIPDGWPVAIVGTGVNGLDATSDPLSDKDYWTATVVDANTIKLVTPNTSTGKNPPNPALLDAYVSGGYVQLLTPVDLSGYTARMTIRDQPASTGTSLLSLTTENSRIVLDNTAKTITRTIAAADAASATWSQGWYDMEMVSASGVVTKLEPSDADVEDGINYYEAQVIGEITT